MKVSIASLLKQAVGDHIDLHVEEQPVDPRGDNADLLDADITGFDADIKATHTDPGAYLEGDLNATVDQECVRCLRPVRSPVSTRFAEQYYAKERVETGAPMPEAPRDAKTIGSDFMVDLTPLIREEVILATPQAPLCRPDCRGLCPECGTDLNDSPHEHEDAPTDRWAALAKLRAAREAEDAPSDDGM